jgi:hypothetical protein
MQADFVEPTHDKQDFEKTSLFQKLEARLKAMTWEYWCSFCACILYLCVSRFTLTYSLLFKHASVGFINN